MVWRCAALALLLLLDAWPAASQQRVFAVTIGSDAAFLWEARLDDTRLSEVAFRATVPGTVTGQPIVAGGGRYVVWGTSTSSGQSAFAVFDRVGGGSQVFAIGGGARPVDDPTAVRLYLPIGGQIGRLAPEGLSMVAGTAGLTPIGVSPDGRHIYALRTVGSGPPPLLQAEVVDALTGTLVASAPIGAMVDAKVADDEASVWAVSYVASVPTLRKIAMPSGVEQLSIPLPVPINFPPSSYTVAAIDAARRRVFVSLDQVGARYSLPGKILSYDLDTGAEGPVVTTAGVSNLSFDAAAGSLLVYSTNYLYTIGCDQDLIQTISTATGQETASLPLGTTTCFRAAFGAPPRAPVLASPTVSPSRSVTLSWTRSPELITGVTVEAGSAPGSSNLATLAVASGTTVTVPNVPPGTYYVRVRALNDIGASVPSNEIVVQVP